MSYPAYSEYEDSEVPWIGQKPKHWQVMKLHHMVRMRSGSSITSVEMDDDGDYPVFGGNGVRGRFPEFTHEGDYVLIGRQGAECGNINYAHGKFWASEHAVVATPDRKLEYRWLGETLRAMNLNQYSQAAAQPGLSVEVIGRLKLPFPPVPEQRQIAAFLDWKTGQIDALIARKEELLEKLKEKRIAVITQAVTKGLNPAAPMRDSGIPWLGQVPQHWEVLRIASCSTKLTNGYVGPTRDILTDEGVRYLQSLHIKNNTIIINRPFFVSEEWSLEHARSILKEGDVLIVQTGDIGQVAVVTKEFEGCNCHALIIVEPERGRLHGPFLSWFLNSNPGSQTLKSIQTGALHPHLNCTVVHDIQLPLPQLDEQIAIGNYIDAEVSKIDLMMNKVESVIDRLTEYRNALVTAATTGKIDVRGVKIPQLFA